MSSADPPVPPPGLEIPRYLLLQAADEAIDDRDQRTLSWLRSARHKNGLDEDPKAQAPAVAAEPDVPEGDIERDENANVPAADPLFQGDTGRLKEETRRVLVQLLSGPSVDGRRQPQLWTVLLRDRRDIASRLNELFLELVVDADQRVAFIRQAGGSDDDDLPVLLRRQPLTFIESALVLHLRRRLTEADRADERAVNLEDNLHAEVLVGIGPFRDGLSRSLRRAAIDLSDRLLVGMRALEGERNASWVRYQTAFEELSALLSDKGGSRLNELELKLKAAIEGRQARQLRKGEALLACKGLGITLPDDAERFEGLRAAVRTEMERSLDGDANDKEPRELAVREGKLVEEIRVTQEELVELERAPGSNIRGNLLAMRRSVADRVGCRIEDLPFAGELIEVRESERGWQGAIERVLRGFALSLLVSEKLYGPVADAVDAMHLGGRLVYLRCLPHQHDDARLDPRSVAAKVSVADGDFTRWVHDELKMRFDVLCVETALEMRALPSAVTRAGQIQRGRRHHEKDDRSRVDDQSGWVLGANTEAKAQRLLNDLSRLNAELDKVRTRLEELSRAEKRSRQRLVDCQRLIGYSWQDIDLATSVADVDSFNRLIQELMQDQTVAALQAQVKGAKAELDEAKKTLDEQQDKIKRQEWTRAEHERILSKLDEAPAIDCTPTQTSGIEAALQELRKQPSLESIGDDMRAVERHIEAARADIARKRSDRERDIVEAFRDFLRNWATEAEGLDATLHSYDDFAAKLRRLEEEDLPSVRDKFLALLEEQSNQHSAFLGDRLDSDRREIYDRMDAVNQSLRTAEFNPGSYLKIEVEDHTPPDARSFREDLAKALAQTLGVGTPASPEQRFVALKRIIHRLASQAAEDVHWRDLILDVIRWP